MHDKQTMVHVITNFSGVGGAEMMLARLIEQTQHEYDHVVIALMKISEVYQETLSYCRAHYALAWNGLNSLKVVLELRKLLQQLAAPTVQCWMYHANVMTSLALLSMPQKPRVFWGIHHSLAAPKEESISTKLALMLSKLLSKQANGIVYCAHSSLQQHQQFGLENQHNYVIANGVKLDQFQPNPQLHQPCVIGFAGRLHQAKGYPYLFATIAQLKQHAIIFKIAGQGANLNQAEIQGYFKQYQLDPKQVQLLDQVSDMPAFYQSIDAFLMTSITEGFPNVLVEAMASGLPCISTDVGDAGYIVQDLGTIVAPRDSHALAQAILAYVHLSDTEKQQLKHQTRQRVADHFAIESVSQQYINVWRQGQ